MLVKSDANNWSGQLEMDAQLYAITHRSKNPISFRSKNHGISLGASGTPKNLIFASINSKPDLYFTDAINNDIGIRNESDALVYSRFLPESGLNWTELVDWWTEQLPTDAKSEGEKSLYTRLAKSVKTARSPGEYAIFHTYFGQYRASHGAKLLALIPQVYLHYDPKTVAQRGNDPVLVRQRMDFLMLLDHNVRVVIEVDGKQHFADGDVASPSKYAEMAAEDRRLRLAGYDIYRFGAAEFKDTKMEENRYKIGPESVNTVTQFFAGIFSKYGVKQ